MSSTVGLRLANSFHPQIWHVARRGHHRSPILNFQNDDTLRKVLLRAVKLWPDKPCWCAYTIRAMFRIHSGGRVANFRPTASKALIQKYSADGAKILDFCSGFGGRLLGAAALKRHYTGIDASYKQVVGTRKMYNSIKSFALGAAEFHKGCAEDIMPTMRSGSFDLIFTSPPYFNQEKYGHKTDQSYLRYRSFTEWKDGFLQTVIRESHRLLKPKGYLIINISDVRRYELTSALEDVAHEYFKLVDKYSLYLSARPVHMKNGSSYKSEPVYVFRK